MSRSLDEPFTTVFGWEKWPTATDEERKQMLADYRETVRREIERADWPKMDRAIAKAGRG